jgi:ankyrin repeat protein
VEALLLTEHDIDAVDMFGHTALIAACYNGHSRVAQRLMAAGANTEFRTPLGESVKGIAHREGMVELLNGPFGTSSLKASV